MSTLQFELPGARVLDLFAGSGALGLEALSRGATHATFVEYANAALRALRANVQALDVAPGSCEIVRADALAWAGRLDAGAYDVALADPPYAGGEATALAEIYRDRAFARILAIEHAAAAALPGLPGSRTRHYGDTAITYYMADE